MADEPVFVAVVGFGYWGPNLVRNFARSPRARVTWICDLDPGRRRAAERDFPQARASASVDDMLRDAQVELVVIATPISTHFDLARRALEAGKHVLVEKPLTAEVAQAEALVDLARRVDRRLFVDHTYLFTPEVRYLRDLVARGDLGQLLYFDGVRINLGLFQTDHDVVWDLAPHDLSILLALAGRPPRSVVCVGSSHTASGLTDVAMLHLDFGDQLTANVHVNWLSPVKVRHVIVAGTRRMVLYNDLEATEKVRLYDRGIEVTDADAQRRAAVGYRLGDVLIPHIPAREALAVEVEEVVACLRDGATPTSPGELGVEVVRVLEALGRSLERRGERIDLTTLTA